VGVSNPLTARASLLQVLMDGPGYGTELIARFRGRAKGLARLTPARVYPVLKALERERLVRAVRVAPRARRGGRTRVYYVLTAAGRRAARAQRDMLLALLRPASPEGARDGERERMAERLLEAEALSEAGADLAAAGR
jgi:DNA-binding PadR family transcriptional regulator